MARRKRKPREPDAILEARRAKARAIEDARLREQGVDPAIARWGEDPVSPDREAAMKAHGFEAPLDHRRRMTRCAHKADIWSELCSRNRLTQEQLTAVRALQELMARRAGLAGRGEGEAYAETKVEATGDVCAVTDAMLAAGVKMDIALRLVGPPSSRLLAALLWPSVLGAARTMAKPMRRCTAWDHRVLKDKSGHVFAAGGRRTCETLNEPDAKRCKGCGGALTPRLDEDGNPTDLETISVPEDWRAIVARVTGERNEPAQAALLRYAAQALADVQDDVERLVQRHYDLREEAALGVSEPPRDRVEPLFV